MPRTPRTPALIAGMGGLIMPYRHASLSEVIGNQKMDHGPYLDIASYRVRHQMLLAPVTQSGSNGAVQRHLVGQDWWFEAELPWNARLVASRSKEAVGFLEELLIGHQDVGYRVSCLFTLGDALSYNESGAGGADYQAGLFAPEALLEVVDTTVRSDAGASPDAVIRTFVRGQGTSLLQGVRGNDVHFNVLQ